MKRREFFKQAGISSAALVSLPAVAALEPGASGAEELPGQSEREHRHGGGRQRPHRAAGRARRSASANGMPIPRLTASQTTPPERRTAAI